MHSHSLDTHVSHKFLDLIVYMDTSAVIILKLNEIERKIEAMQSRIDSFEVRSDSDEPLSIS